MKDVSFVKFDVDDDAGVAANLGVQAMPCLMFMVDGEVKDRMEGAFPAAEIVRNAERVFGLVAGREATTGLSDQDLGESMCS